MSLDGRPVTAVVRQTRDRLNPSKLILAARIGNGRLRMTELESPARRKLSITLRELFLVTLIAALGISLLLQRMQKSESQPAPSRSLLHVPGPVKYRFWHQRGERGSGTGTIGSGNEWQNADGISFFETFIVVFRSDGGRLIPREGMTYFDWIPRDDSSASQSAPSGSH